MNGRAIQRNAWLLPLLVISSGCALPITRPDAPLSSRPYVLHLPGIAGDSLPDRLFLSALHTGGFDADFELFDWTKGRTWVQALQDEARSKAEALQVAGMIAKVRAANPDRPVFLTAESGGAGVATWALEDLPPDVMVDGVILISPALSRGYDLSAALRHVRDKFVVFYSPSDAFILGYGTRTYGTVDRRFEDASGRFGFIVPATADPLQYQKLDQRKHDSDWFWTYGNSGGHVEPMNVRFASGYIAPILIELASHASDGVGATAEENTATNRTNVHE